MDVSEESIKEARDANKVLDDITFSCFDGSCIPFDVEFDIVFAAGVFHHIKREMHVSILKHIHQKLTKGGLLFLFELNPLNPLTMLVAIKNDYRFDKDARLLSPYYSKTILAESGFSKNEVRYTIFFPKPLSFLISYEKYLGKIPLGAHYYYIASL